MADNFTAGEADAAGAQGPPYETMGARYGIGMARPVQPSNPTPKNLTEPYLMPSVHGRNGSMERVDPAITLTPLGGMMPHPAMPAPQVFGHVGAFPTDPSLGGFEGGVADACPEGCPVPYKVR